LLHREMLDLLPWGGKANEKSGEQPVAMRLAACSHPYLKQG
tara:strand:+ start:3548 stop:3670 length:123 start_codon:yes stop_codon:yes gene_type:complete